MTDCIKPKFIGITGGSGAGKSTLALSLIRKYPDIVGLIQLDDYFRPENEVPMLKGMLNYDSPDAIYLDKLVHDLHELSEGKSTTINTKNEILNPEYQHTSKRILAVFQPKPIMLVEGFLVLHDPRVRELLDTSIWLEVPHVIRWERRVHFKYPEYEEIVLKPMQAKYFEPTRKFAGHVLNVKDYPKEAILSQVERLIGLD